MVPICKMNYQNLLVYRNKKWIGGLGKVTKEDLREGKSPSNLSDSKPGIWCRRALAG